MTEDVIGPLLDELGPDLYRENAFRVTGLGVHASARDIRRHAEKLRVASRFGAESASGSASESAAGSALFGAAPDAAEARQAAQRLRDPARRLLDELFWFWPLQPGRPDQAVAAVRRGDLGEAERVWTDAASPAGRHNLAVLAHARALDDSGAAPWPEAFAAWLRVVHDEEFWPLLEARARDLADPRLGPGTAARIRDDLPEALLTINARLAVTALRDGRRAEAEAQVAAMTGSGFDRLDVTEALRRAVEPGAARLRTIGEHAEHTADADPARGAEAAERLLDQAAPLLDVLALAHPQDGPVLRGARDDVANRVLGCVIPYANATDDWPPAVRVLERALPVAATTAVREHLSGNLDIAKGNLARGTCLFCEEQPSDEGSFLELKLSGDIQHQVGRVAWQVFTVNVPRCASCRSGHGRRRVRIHGSAFGTAAGGAALGIGALAAGLTGPGIAVLIAVAIGYVVFLGAFNNSLSKDDRAKVLEFAPIRDRMKEGGWFFGSRPPGVN
ncbi:hypothetical protein [Actinomadura sp. NEAU-AAG7]|uniref:hypothetical protein n=1 Tax=Actinomadura sp. NEAU-AAG7 TaxID=2839640 RepID=UPI001BE46B7C|nr:hypothetical protein [Actinomadura sp. NEAU-AAG7]MBT2208940.1 hypothetical protein [Actinomadura sp. NEAU-AAG7]